MTEDTLDRFFHALVEALRDRKPADLSAPFTVAEIYQDLVPYRTHRDVLGFEMNGDYEHALLRLLAGQEGYLQMESEHALREIQAELDGKNPDTSLYRDFAAVDVRIVPGMVPPAEPTDDASSAEEADVEDAEISSGADTAPAPEELDALAADAAPAPDTSEGSTTFVEGAEPGTSRPAPGGAGDGACPWCRSELPDREGLAFCPFCGENQELSPCRSCGAALEADWEFCISCGAQKAR